MKPAKHWHRASGHYGFSTTTGFQGHYGQTTARNNVNTVTSFGANRGTRCLQYINATSQNHHIFGSLPCCISIPSLFLVTLRTSANEHHIPESPGSQRNSTNVEFSLLQPPGAQGKQDREVLIALNVLTSARYF